MSARGTTPGTPRPQRQPGGTTPGTPRPQRQPGGSPPEPPAHSVNPGHDPREPPARRWLLLIYRVPAEPTRLRAAVWRRIKGLGAIYLQNSAAALPHAVGAERALRALRKEITEMGGTAYLLSTDVLAGEADIERAFNAARDAEYEEIVDRCARTSSRRSRRSTWRSISPTRNSRRTTRTS